MVHVVADLNKHAYSLRFKSRAMKKGLLLNNSSERSDYGNIFFPTSTTVLHGYLRRFNVEFETFPRCNPPKKLPVLYYELQLT
jgi:hypothetical protein